MQFDRAAKMAFNTPAHDFMFIVKEMKNLFRAGRKLFVKLKTTAFVRPVTAE